MSKLTETIETPNLTTLPIKSNKKESTKQFKGKNAYLLNKLIEVIEKKGETDYHFVLDYINNEIQESIRSIEFSYQIPCFMEDGLYALSKAVSDIVGYTNQKDEKAPSGSNPPQMINVRFADGTNIKCPFGQINLPKYGNDAYIDMQYNKKTRTLHLTGRCEKRYTNDLDKIVELTRTYIREDSIYKNQAIKINSPEDSPEFIDLTHIQNTNLFLTPEAQFATTPIEARIEKTEQCRRNGIDIKFGAILAGSYGVGKTLYAFKLAYKAISHGWSFIYCSKPEHTLYVLEVANMLSHNGKGCVVFIEDINEILNERTNKTNEISILMDGGETKNNNIISIFTTNHLDLIDPTFLRGKRIGSIVTLTHPDVKTAEKIINSAMVDENGLSILEDDCIEAAEIIEREQIVPAFIMEILDRVKAHLLYENKKTVSCQDIINSINSYKEQMNIARLKNKEIPKEQVLVNSLIENLGIKELNEKVTQFSIDAQSYFN